MLQEGPCETISITGCKLLMLPDHRAAIVFSGHRPSNEQYSVAFEITHELLHILRTEVAKAERCLSLPAGSA